MKNSLLVHKHLIIRAEASRPPTDEEQLQEWMRDFIESINMKVFMGPYVKYCNMPGNRGITAVAIIETSHIAMHVWDEVKPALIQFDVYSCGEFDHEQICNKIKEDFRTSKITRTAAGAHTLDHPIIQLEIELLLLRFSLPATKAAIKRC